MSVGAPDAALCCLPSSLLHTAQVKRSIYKSKTIQSFLPFLYETLGELASTYLVGRGRCAKEEALRELAP